MADGKDIPGSDPARHGTVRDVVAHRGAGPVVTVPEDVSLSEVVGLMRLHGISQIPVMRAGKVVGVLTDAHLLDALITESATPQTAGAVSDPGFAVVDLDTDVLTAAARLRGARVALVLDPTGAPTSVLSPIDLLDHLLRRGALGGWRGGR